MREMRWLVALPLMLALVAGCSDGDDGVVGGGLPSAPKASVAPLTENGAREANPVYSPDGQWIVYESDVSGNDDLWRIPAAGGEPRQLTFDPAFDSYPSWTHDGGGIVFESERSGQKALWYLDLSTPGAMPVPVTDGDEMEASPACSPTGPEIVFESLRDKNGGSDIWVVNLDGSGLRRLTHGPDGTYARTAAWSPDGASVVYEASATGYVALYTVPGTGGTPSQITPDQGYEGHPSWSPDGAWIALEAYRDGLMNVYLVHATGGGLIQVTTAGGHWPEWAPDGLHLAYGVLAGDKADIWIAELEDELLE